MMLQNTTAKAGILGGGQLGRMLLQQAINYPVLTYVMENDPHCPAAHLCHHFILGNIQKFEDVYNFGKGLDVLTIEIESVNVEAPEQLENEGVKVYPTAAALKTIQNKILQKQFYIQHGIPTSDFVITENKNDLAVHQAMLPAVHKVAMGGYDGRGVQIIKTISDFSLAFDAPSVMEKMVNIKKEIAVMVAMNDKGDTALYPPVEMIFDPSLNLLDYQICPAKLEQQVLWKCEAIALKVVKELKSPGIFAIELFVDHNNDVFVNETAPRVHNSGHHTIEANYSSQFDMLWRVMLGYPLGNTAVVLPSAIINILGAPNYNGTAVYEGLDEVLKLDNVYVHLYGKAQTKPGRKMGHVTIVSNEPQELIHQANQIKSTLKVVSSEGSGNNLKCSIG